MIDFCRTFFDEDYAWLWHELVGDARTEREVDGLWRVLRLRRGARVLDAPCGYGRLSRHLRDRGAHVLGLDLSCHLLDRAERERAGRDHRLRYLRHDLREPLIDEGGFDAAINIFSSLGYASDDDDRAILRTLREAVRPGGLVFVETFHRDAALLEIARKPRRVSRLRDETLIVEDGRFDPISGRLFARWQWRGPRGAGMKSASLRMYCATELVALVESAGLVVRSTHAGCSEAPFAPTAAGLAGRLGILAVRDGDA